MRVSRCWYVTQPRKSADQCLKLSDSFESAQWGEVQQCDYTSSQETDSDNCKTRTEKCWPVLVGSSNVLIQSNSHCWSCCWSNKGVENNRETTWIYTNISLGLNVVYDCISGSVHQSTAIKFWHNTTYIIHMGGASIWTSRDGCRIRQHQQIYMTIEPAWLMGSPRHLKGTFRNWKKSKATWPRLKQWVV